MNIAAIDNLFVRYPGRQVQIQSLIELVGNPHLPAIPSLIVYGLPSTGKTSILKELSNTFPPRHAAFINCVECYSPKLIFEYALNEWAGTVPCLENGFKGYARCDSPCDFVKHVKSIINKDDGSNHYLIIDKAELLREMPPAVLATLMTLPQSSNRNISVILISTISWEKFRNAKIAMPEPYMLHFPQYTETETITILKNECPQNWDSDLLEAFVNQLYSKLRPGCRDIAELAHFVKILFPKYIKPVTDGKVDSRHHHKLAKLVNAEIQEAISKLYLREASAEAYKNEGVTKTDSAEANQVELPTVSRFLLIASFLASYNPARLDSRFFAKGADGSKRKNKVGIQAGRDRTKQLLRQQLQGPKAFPVERMLAIFYNILPIPIPNTIDIQQQIASLIALRLLTRLTALDRLDAMKCKCNVSYEFIQRVAHSVSFAIGQYLYDFVG